MDRDGAGVTYSPVSPERLNFMIYQWPPEDSDVGCALAELRARRNNSLSIDDFDVLADFVMSNASEDDHDRLRPTMARLAMMVRR